MILASALVLALAAWLAIAPSPEPRLAHLMPSPHSTDEGQRGTRNGATWLATGAAALGCLLLAGGFVGVALAVACCLVVPRATGRLETRAERQRRDALGRQAPVVADLLSATVAAGSPMSAALAAVAGALGEPARGALQPVQSAVGLGADPEVAWQALVADPVLGPVATAVIRSARTGAPLAAMLARIADDLRRERRIAVEVAAQSAGVKAVVPLAACFLPAFLLLGVVPVVVSLATGLASGG
ncbi:MAG: type II secretion system F family protein [Actinobacteria bacterium]|nr:type II secretion system F family protein [Actinomycetota bacterium]